MKIFIETGRLILRKILSSDEEGLFELDSNPKVRTYLGNNAVGNMDLLAQYVSKMRVEFCNRLCAS